MEAYTLDLRDDRISRGAIDNVEDFTHWAVSVSSMATAMIITHLSAAVQLLFKLEVRFLAVFLIVMSIFYLVVLGVDLTDSIHDPYFHKSFTERWCISPSTAWVVAVNLVFVVIISVGLALS